MKNIWEVIERDNKFTYKHEYFEKKENAEKYFNNTLIGVKNITIKEENVLRKVYEYNGIQICLNWIRLQDYIFEGKES